MERTETGNLSIKTPAVQALWEAYCSQERLDPSTPYQAWFFGDSQQLAHELIELVIHGPKRGTAGLLWMHERVPEQAPILGGYSVLTEFGGTPRAVIRTTDVQVCRFDEVDATFAWDEGEGDRSLLFWRQAHWAYFSRECAELGREPSLDMPIVLERFELLFVC